jgi:tetratricopeptide (TPR) repeat protein
MHHDRYELEITAASDAAAELYRQAVDAFLAAQYSAEPLLEQLLTIDPESGVGRIGLARLRQSQGRGAQARAEAERALELAPKLLPREASHIEALASVIRGEGRVALAKVQAHLHTYPRDVMVLAPATGVFGLIGFSGQAQREQALLQFLQPYCAGLAQDWWFNAALAFAECETGLLEAASRRLELSWQLNPHSANTAHIRAHIEYEQGRDHDTLAWLETWLANYDRAGLMHCHLGWHVALARLRLNDGSGALETLHRWVYAPQSGAVAWGPPLNLVTDSISLIYRAWLRGAAVTHAQWSELLEHSRRLFATPGIRFADFHLCISFAMAGAERDLEQWLAQIDGPTASLIRHAALGFLAIAQSRWDAAISALQDALPQHEILGGSRAQRDLLLEALSFAQGRGTWSIERHRVGSPRAQPAGSIALASAEPFRTS